MINCTTKIEEFLAGYKSSCAFSGNRRNSRASIPDKALFHASVDKIKANKMNIAKSGLLIAVTALSVFVLDVAAGEQKVSIAWNAVTHDVSGETMPAEEVSGYKVYYSLNDPATKEDAYLNATGIKRSLILNLAPGKYDLYIAVSTIRTITSEDGTKEVYESDIQSADKQGFTSFTVNKALEITDPSPECPQVITLKLTCADGLCEVAAEAIE